MPSTIKCSALLIAHNNPWGWYNYYPDLQMKHWRQGEPNNLPKVTQLVKTAIKNINTVLWLKRKNYKEDLC